MSGAFVDWSEGGEIATLVLNRPEAMNAIDVPMARAFGAAVAQIVAKPPRAVILRGEGRAFVAGGDLKRFADDIGQAAAVVDELLDALHPAITALAALPAPKIAAVHGAVAGAGLSLAAGCDLVIAAQGTRFLMAYDRIGAAMDCGGTWYLPRRIGRRNATRLMLLSQVWEAEEAQRAGLVDRIVAQEALQSEAQALAGELAARPTAAFAAWRQLIDGSETRSLEVHLEMERLAFRKASRTEDFAEGVAAFLDKRAADFKGR